MRLSFFDLILFLNIVETGSLTKGAELSAISLQAASERIKKLEQHYQTHLFNRHAAGVKLSLAGQQFAEHAQRLLNEYHRLEQHMQRFSKGQQQSICLWCNSSAQSEYLPQLLPQYLNENPQLQIDFKEAESSDIIHALQQGQAELGIVSSFFSMQQLQSLVLCEDPLVLICAKQHCLAKQKSIDLTDALSFAFVGLMPYHSLQKSIETQAKQLGFNLHYRLRLPNFSAIAQVVADGVGVAIMPKRAMLRYAQQFNFHSVELHGAWANRQLHIAARDFDKLSIAYQHLTQFLLSQKGKLALD
ncbi:LysR substrate-binding domain-containing protein [Acinetobacter rudis]|uniref:LysR substrate-binding domain-containing protein n=1 Tax=Acinetobacter rudis TaxID=632955 RepID=UPI0033400EBD